MEGNGLKQAGLSSNEVADLQTKYGRNELISEKKESFPAKVLHIVSEPMFVLLLVRDAIQMQNGFI